MPADSRTIAVGVLTGLRVPLSVAAAALVWAAAPGGAAAWAAVALLIAGELTDMLDGMLARRLGATSRFGELFDPYCDSVSRLVVYFGLAAAGITPWWLLLVLAIRDVSVSYVRLLCLHTGRKVAARWTGKIKAIVQGPGAIVLAATAAVPAVDRAEWIDAARATLVWVVALVTGGSLIDYFLAAVKPEGAKKSSRPNRSGPSEEKGHFDSF